MNETVESQRLPQLEYLGDATQHAARIHGMVGYAPLFEQFSLAEIRLLGHFMHTFRAQAGDYTGRWFDETFKKDENELDRTNRLLARLHLTLPDAEQRLDPANGSLWDEHRTATRLWHREIADAVERLCRGKQGVVELEEKKPSTQAPPQRLRSGPGADFSARADSWESPRTGACAE